MDKFGLKLNLIENMLYYFIFIDKNQTETIISYLLGKIVFIQSNANLYSSVPVE